MGKLLIAFGANAAVVGLFLPVARVVERLSSGDRHYDVRIWGGFNVVDWTQTFGFILLGFFSLLALMGIWMMATEATRGKALAALLFAIPAEAVAVYILTYHLASIPGDAKAGPGLILMVIGGGMTVLGALLSCIWPARAPRRPQSHRQENVSRA